MLKGNTEAVDVELESASLSAPHAYLIKVGKMFIHKAYIVFVWESLFYSSSQFAFVAAVIKQYGIGFLSVASGSSCFLKICFRRSGSRDV